MTKMAVNAITKKVSGVYITVGMVMVTQSVSVLIAVAPIISTYVDIM
jgi:hypothetical protein